MLRDLTSWLTSFRWSAVWSLAPSLPHHNALAAISTGRKILRLWGEHTGAELGALLVAEPHPGTRVWHIHSLISTADDFKTDAFREFSSKWGQSEVQPYRSGGGYCSYIAHKLLRDDTEWELYGEIPLKEVKDAQCN